MSIYVIYSIGCVDLRSRRKAGYYCPDLAGTLTTAFSPRMATEPKRDYVFIHISCTTRSCAPNIFFSHLPRQAGAEGVLPRRGASAQRRCCAFLQLPASILDKIPMESTAVKPIYVVLLTNLATQLVCVSSVNWLTSMRPARLPDPHSRIT